jgi:hypothetical protein
MTFYIRRRTFNNETWYQLNDTDIHVDLNMLERIKECCRIVDLDALKLERELQSRLN